jgi:antitoxin component YwqK of YwqJK toxin-antitoxin module
MKDNSLLFSPTLQIILVFTSFSFFSCSEKTEVDLMNEIWDNAVEWIDLIDQNGSALSQKTGQVLNGWAKKEYPDGNFLFLAEFKDGYATRILQWDEGGMKLIDAGVIKKSIKFSELPLKDIKSFSPFTGPIFQTIQNQFNPKPLEKRILDAEKFTDFNGSVKTWYKNGCPRLISYWNNGKLEGNFTNYWNTLLVFHDPPIRIKGTISNGLIDGNLSMNYVADTRVNELENLTIYNLDFIAKFHGMFKNGKRHGLFSYTRANGNISQSTFFNDHKDGTCITWSKSGVKTLETEFVKGFKDGPHKEWHNNGNLKEEGEFEVDKKIGKYFFYDQNGKKLYHQTYKYGKLIIE